MKNNNLIGNRQIRIFISSTFQDMQGERDYLIKYTYPELRKIAAMRDVTLTEVDLRWGITEEESKSGKVVEICLSEIENSIPFFIGIIGNRYGWVPTRKDLEKRVTERFSDVNTYISQHLSVTEMEMQFGVLSREEDMHAYFYIKEQEAKDVDNPEMLRRLKEEVRKSRYPSSYYKTPEDLAQQVKEAFLSLLDSLFPEARLSAHQKNKLIQKSFIRALSSTYIKEEHSFSVLNDFLKDDSSQFLVVTGESGIGKSALLANWYLGATDSISIIPYFVSNGGNLSYTNILKYIADEMCERYGFSETEGSEKEQLERAFNLFSAGEDKLIIVIDAINQIADLNHSKQLNWLPIAPDNIKFVLSTLEKDETMEVFKYRKYPIFHLHELDTDKRESLICRYLESYGKKLTDMQVKRIVNCEMCRNTLMLRTLLDELISFGIYEKLDEKIDQYLRGNSVSDFYNNVIDRFESDFGEKLVKDVLGLIAVSRNGLTEEEIITMTHVRPLEWSQFFYGFITHLNNQSGRFVFTHNYIAKTVWAKYLDSDKTFENECRRRIIGVASRDDNSYSMQEIPYQYDKLQDWENLHDYILNPEYLIFSINSDELEIGLYWRHLFDAKDSFSVLDYQNYIRSTDDKVLFLMKLLRLCRVLCQEKEAKIFARILLNMVTEQPELEKPEVYFSLVYGRESTQQYIDFARKSLDLCREEDIENRICAYKALSGAYYEQAVYFNDEEAERKRHDILKEMHALCIEHYGEIHPHVETVYQELALCDFEERKMMYADKAVELGIALYGENNPHVGRSYHYKGVLLREQQDWDKAYEYFRKAYDVWLPAYGLNHEIIASSLGNQGMALLNLHRYEEALDCYDKCREVLSVIYEEKGFEYALSTYNSARVLFEMGRRDEAAARCLIAEGILQSEKVRTQDRAKDIIARCSSLRERT